MFDSLSEKLNSAFKNLSGRGKISEKNIEETLKQVKTALLEADVNFKVVKSFIQAVKEKALGEKVISGVNPGEQFVKIMHDELAAIMGQEHEELDLTRTGVVPILIVGLNGAGKTTFTGKLAHYLQQKLQKKLLLVPADNFRPAAKDQLQTLARQIEAPFFDSDLTQDPAQIARAGFEQAQRDQAQVCLIDTAGRLHVDQDLMAQLQEVKKTLEPYRPEVLFVADAMTGQEAVEVARTFHQALGLTGVVLSKMDSDARGGAALSIRHATGVPIRFISVGEKMGDLEKFHPDRLAGRILDMGDVVTLVEKAQEVIDEQEAQKMMEKMEKNKFTINDFIKQMEQISRLGSMGDLLKMIPGMGGMMRQLGDLSVAEEEMKRIKVMASSMTRQEKEDHKILNPSRLQRIARGSGHTVQAVKEFINKFNQMQQMMGPMLSMMKGGGGLGDMMGMMNPFGGAGPTPGGPRPGFRQAPGGKGKKGKKGKRRGPWGGGFF